MTWDFKFAYGLAHTSKLYEEYLFERPDFESPTNIESYKHDWAKFIAESAGLSGPSIDEIKAIRLEAFNGLSYDDLRTLPKGERARLKEKERQLIMAHVEGLVRENYDEASKIIQTFESSGADKCFMTFDHDGASGCFKSVAIFGLHSVIQTGFWSID